MNVSAVIVTYNNEDTIIPCIQSLHDHGITDVIVVDNNSGDQTYSLASTKTNNTVKLSHNNGFAAGVNAGVQQTSTELVLVINPDSQLKKTIQPALSNMKESPKVGVVGLSLVDGKGRPEPHSFGAKVDLLSLLTRKIKKSILPQEPKMVGWVSGGAMLIRRQAFKDVGGFDEKFFLYWEDVDFCKRVQEHGWQVMIDPRVLVEHQRGHSLSDASKKTKIYDQSADRYFRKHYPAMIWKSHQLLRRLHRISSPRVD